MKEKIIPEICTQLASLRIPISSDNRSSIMINTEFLDASWSTGSKKISYEASILADEAQLTVFMFEKTVNIGEGFSAGLNSDSSFQSGTTLFRKVKSIQYGPEGKAYEFTLDLGAIPKAVKEAAVRNGWKFKTVLNRDKARPQTNVIQPQGGYIPSFKAKHMQSDVKPKKIRPVLIAAFSILSLITVFLFALSGSSMIGWIISLLLLAATFALLITFSGKSVLSGFLILIISLVLIFITYAFSLPGSNTGSISDADNAMAESSSSTSGENTSVSANDASTSAADSIFIVDYLSINSQPIVKTNSISGKSPSSLSIRTRFIIDINTNMDYFNNGKATQDDLSIASATLSVTPVNIQNGNVVTFTYIGNDNILFEPKTLASQALMSPYQIPVFNTYEEVKIAEESGNTPYILSLVKNTTSMQLRFGTGLLGITPEVCIIDFSKYLEDAIDEAASNGLDANTLRYQVNVRISLVTASGKTQTIDFTRDVMPEGYNMLTITPGGAQYTEDYQSDKTHVANDLYSKPSE